MKLMSRLELLEAAASKLKKQMAVVLFKDGTTIRTMLPDAIPLLKKPIVDDIAAISSDESNDGKLSDLLDGLLEE